MNTIIIDGVEYDKDFIDVLDALDEKEKVERADFFAHLDYFKEHNLAHPDTLEELEEDGFYEMEKLQHLGYVHVAPYKSERYPEKRFYKIVENDKKYFKGPFEWQASDNYAVNQTTGHLGDDYYGQLLFPLDDGTWWCVGYEC